MVHTHTHVSVSGDETCSFFGKFDVLCFLVTIVYEIRPFALLPTILRPFISSTFGEWKAYVRSCQTYKMDFFCGSRLRLLSYLKLQIRPWEYLVKTAQWVKALQFNRKVFGSIPRGLLFSLWGLTSLWGSRWTSVKRRMNMQWLTSV